MSRKTCKIKDDDDDKLILKVCWLDDRQRWVCWDDHDLGVVASHRTKDGLLERIVRMTPHLMDYSSEVRGHA